MLTFPIDQNHFSPSYVHKSRQHATPKRTCNPLMDITNITPNKTPKHINRLHRKKKFHPLKSPWKQNQSENLIEQLLETPTGNCEKLVNNSMIDENYPSDKTSSPVISPSKPAEGATLLVPSLNTPKSQTKIQITLAGSSPPRYPHVTLEQVLPEPVQNPSSSKIQDVFLLRSMFSHLRLFGNDSFLNLFLGWTIFHVVHNSTSNKRIRALSLIPSMEMNAHQLLLLQLWRTFVAIVLTNLVSSSNFHPLSLAIVDAWNLSLLFVDYGPVVVCIIGWFKQQSSENPKDEETPQEGWNLLESLDSWMFLIHHILFCKPLIVLRLLAYIALLSINPSVLGLPFVEVNPVLFQPNQLNLLRSHQ